MYNDDNPSADLGYSHQPPAQGLQNSDTAANSTYRHFPPTDPAYEGDPPNPGYNNSDLSADLGYGYQPSAEGYQNSNTAANPTYGYVPPTDLAYEGNPSNPGYTVGHENSNTSSYGYQPPIPEYTHNNDSYQQPYTPGYSQSSAQGYDQLPTPGQAYNDTPYQPMGYENTRHAVSKTPSAANWLLTAEIFEERGHPSGVHRLPMPIRHGEPEGERGARVFQASI